MAAMRILIVEDNRALSTLLKTVLATAGLDADIAGTAEEAELSLLTITYSGIILDLGLPDKDGLELLRLVRRRGVITPVLVLTARNSIGDRVKGLNAGADDYLVKPFASEELVARVQALLRRSNPDEKRIAFGDITFDPRSQQAYVAKRSIACSRREAAILELLMRRGGRVVPVEALGEALYGPQHPNTSNAVQVYVHRLRKKLADANAETTIHNISGVGYILSAGASK